MEKITIPMGNFFYSISFYIVIAGNGKENVNSVFGICLFFLFIAENRENCDLFLRNVPLNGDFNQIQTLNYALVN